jgi:hypothetical protein
MHVLVFDIETVPDAGLGRRPFNPRASRAAHLLEFDSAWPAR